MIKLVSIVLLLSGHNLLANTNYQSTGKFFKIGEISENPIYVQTTQITFKKDEKTSTSEIKDATGQIVMTETAIVERGQTIKQTMTQLQINERYELQRDADNETYLFKTYDIANKDQPKLISEDKVKTTKSFYTGPSMVDFLNLNREKLKNAGSSVMSFGIFELQKLIDFSIQKTKSPFAQEQPELLSLKMKIDNALFAFFVDPLYFDIQPDNGRIVRYRGRTPVRLKNKSGDYKPFDADIYYEYKELK